MMHLQHIKSDYYFKNMTKMKNIKRKNDYSRLIQSNIHLNSKNYSTVEGDESQDKEIKEETKTYKEKIQERIQKNIGLGKQFLSQSIASNRKLYTKAGKTLKRNIVTPKKIVFSTTKKHKDYFKDVRRRYRLNARTEESVNEMINSPKAKDRDWYQNFIDLKEYSYQADKIALNEDKHISIAHSYNLLQNKVLDSKRDEMQKMYLNSIKAKIQMLKISNS